MNKLHREFRGLAAARKIMGGGAVGRTLAEDRAGAERWIQRFGNGETRLQREIRKGQARDYDSSRVLRPDDAKHACILYSRRRHGLLHDIHIYAAIAILGRYSGTEIEAFDYLKAPEHSIDVSIANLVNDIARQSEMGDGRPIVLAGDSVGALLALFVATRALPGRFRKLVLIYPVLDLKRENPSYTRYGEGYFLDASAMQRFRAFLEPYFNDQSFDPFDLTHIE